MPHAVVVSNLTGSSHFAERVDSVAELMKWYKIDGTEKLASLQLPSISTFSQGVVQMEQPPVVKDEVNFKNEPESPPPSPTESVSSNGSRANPKNSKFNILL